MVHDSLKDGSEQNVQFKTD